MVQVHPGFGVLLSNFRFADGTADQAAKEQAIGWAIDQLKAALNDVSKVSLSGAWQPADEQKHVVDAMRGNQ